MASPRLDAKVVDVKVARANLAVDVAIELLLKASSLLKPQDVRSKHMVAAAALPKPMMRLARVVWPLSSAGSKRGIIQGDHKEDRAGIPLDIIANNVVKWCMTHGARCRVVSSAFTHSRADAHPIELLGVSVCGIWKLKVKLYACTCGDDACNSHTIRAALIRILKLSGVYALHV